MPRRNAFNSWEPTGDNQPPSPVDLIAAQKKKPRDRTWEKDNPACSYIVPRPLWEAAYQVRDDILSIAQYDERGVPRDDRTTVNAVAAALMDWALQRVEQERALLNLAPNPHARGHLTIAWVEENTWDSLRRSNSRRRSANPRRARKKILYSRIAGLKTSISAFGNWRAADPRRVPKRKVPLRMQFRLARWWLDSCGSPLQITRSGVSR